MKLCVYQPLSFARLKCLHMRRMIIMQLLDF